MSEFEGYAYISESKSIYFENEN